MIYTFVFAVGAVGFLIYLLLMFTAVPGALDERLGKLEPLPDQLGRWVVDQDSPQAEAARGEQLVREVRWLHHPASGLFGREKLIKQVRYRATESGEIVRVDPEEARVRRRQRNG